MYYYCIYMTIHIPYYIISYYIILHYIIVLHLNISYQIISYHIILYRIVSYYIISYYVTVYYMIINVWIIIYIQQCQNMCQNNRLYSHISLVTLAFFCPASYGPFPDVPRTRLQMIHLPIHIKYVQNTILVGYRIQYWLVVSTHLKNISQLG